MFHYQWDCLDSLCHPGKTEHLFDCFNRSLHCIGKHEEALTVYQDAIVKYREALGELHCDTLAAEIDLAFLNIDLERPQVSDSIWLL